MSRVIKTDYHFWYLLLKNDDDDGDDDEEHLHNTYCVPGTVLTALQIQ